MNELNIVLTIIDGKIIDISDKICFIRGQYYYHKHLDECKLITTPIYDLENLSVEQLETLTNLKVQQTEKKIQFTNTFKKEDIQLNLKVKLKEFGEGCIVSISKDFQNNIRVSTKNYGKISVDFEDITEIEIL